MATVTPVPTLSTQGWVTDLGGKIDMLLAHFFLSDYNQTYLYPGRVTSLPELVQRCGGDARELVVLLRRALMDYLTRYYPSVTVEASIPSEDVDPSSRVELTLRISINDGDQVGAPRL